MFLVGNGGYVVSKGLGSDGANIATLAQGLVSLLGGVGAGALGWYKKGSAPKSSTYSDNTEAVQHLASVCKGCPEAEKALQTINSRILTREMEPDA